MTGTRSAAPIPPFSPVLFAGLATRPLPVRFLSRLTALFMDGMDRLYPEISSRLVPLGACRFHIVPTDIWFGFLVMLDNGKATVKLSKKEQAPSNVTATISGDMRSLIQLLEGSADGDALFFSRRLVIEGNTEAVLTLRNAVDSADVSIEHILADITGPLYPLVKRALTRISSLHETAFKDFELVYRSLTGPIGRRISQIDEEIDRQEKLLVQQGKEIRKMQNSVRRDGKAMGNI